MSIPSRQETPESIGTGELAAPRAKEPFVFGHWPLQRRTLGWCFALLLVAGLAFHCANVWRPIDYTTTSSWRECDLGAIARSFWRGQMNILYPQIDWRGTTPGFVESELPLLSWLMAASYRLFGYHEEYGRVLALLVSLATVWVFFRLAHQLLPPFQAKVAGIFFLFSPIMVDLATNLQPDPMMLLAALGCMSFFMRWLKSQRTSDYLLCGLLGAAAIMLKMPALYLGLVFAALSLERYKLGVFKNARLWGLALLMLIPPLLWYSHTHRFWVIYGNSLGISNETHWLGRDMLAKPGELTRLLKNLLRMELQLNFGFLGIVLAGLGAWRAWRQRRLVLLYWLAAAFVFYLIALRTTGDDWAFYYHCLSIPPICLLMGLGCSAPDLLRLRRPGGWAANLFHRSRIIQLASVLTLAYFMRYTIRHGDLLPPRTVDPLLYGRYTAAQWFAPLIPERALIATGGGPGFDETGAPVAHDDSTWMFWLDRKGFVLSKEELNMKGIEAVKKQGARYFISEKEGDLTRELDRKFTVVSRFGPFHLYALGDGDYRSSDK